MFGKAISQSSAEREPVQPLCRKVGMFIAKDGCFALHEAGGVDIWLEIDPIPLNLLDEEVEIIGQQFGPKLIHVRSIGPIDDAAE